MKKKLFRFIFSQKNKKDLDENSPKKTSEFSAGLITKLKACFLGKNRGGKNNKTLFKRRHQLINTPKKIAGPFSRSPEFFQNTFNTNGMSHATAKNNGESGSSNSVLPSLCYLCDHASLK